jgi:hypothetical protein
MLLLYFKIRNLFKLLTFYKAENSSFLFDMAGFCEHGNVIINGTTGGKFRDYLSDY